LKQVFYNAPNNLIDSLARSINEYSDMMDITNSNRMAFFLSQAFAEIGDGMTEIEERRSDVNCEQKYGYKTSVGQSMGNKFPGDGMIFKGRGLLNMTGREDYHNFTIWWNKTFPNNPQDFETNPYLVSQNMDVAVLSGLWEFSVKYNGSALKKADSNNLIALTGQINGGQNGANKRSDGLVLARIALCN
jgi:putative chitinase